MGLLSECAVAGRGGVCSGIGVPDDATLGFLAGASVREMCPTRGIALRVSARPLDVDKVSAPEIPIGVVRERGRLTIDSSRGSRRPCMTRRGSAPALRLCPAKDRTDTRAFLDGCSSIPQVSRRQRHACSRAQKRERWGSAGHRRGLTPGNAGGSADRERRRVQAAHVGSANLRAMCFSQW